MIYTFYLCLLAVVLFHFIFFTLVVKIHREAGQVDHHPELKLKISGRI